MFGGYEESWYCGKVKNDIRTEPPENLLEAKSLIGLISDTHDNVEAVRKAVEIFNQRKVSLVLHAGDYVAPFTARFYRELEAPLKGVFGNVDGDRELLKKRFSEVGGEILGDFAVVEAGSLKIALLHGVDERIVEALMLSGKYRVVVRGHTHKAETRKIGETLMVNPGEACGYLSGKRTIALLNPETLNVEFVEF